MSENVTVSDSHESTSDDSESPAPSRAAEMSIGRFAAAGEKPVDNRPAAEFWNRGAAEAEATKQSFLAELVGEKPETAVESDDDDSEEAEDDAPSAEHDEAVSLSELDDDERRVAAFDYLEQRGVELQIEHDEAEAAQAAEVAADQLFVENVDGQLAQDPEASVEDALEAAAEQTGLDVEAAVEVAQAEAIESDIDSDEDDDMVVTATAPGSGTGGAGSPPPTSPPGTPPGSPPTPNTPPVPPVPPITPGTPPGSPPGPPPGPPGGPPFGPPGPFPPGGPPLGPPTPTPTFNTLTAPTTALTQEDLNAARRRGETSGLIIGGILGYLYGRRRGRIKTERKLLPIQKNLENKVKDLHETVDTKEREIRGLAVDKINNLDELQRSRAAEQLSAQAAKRSAENRQPNSKFNQELQRLIPEDRPGTVPVAERTQIRPNVIAPMFASSGAETTPPPREHIESIERLSQKEILEMSEKVIIGGARLRDIYETKLVTESGLRHILTEFLSGGDIKKALDQEMAVKQLTYELDPKLRDQVSAGYGSNGVASGTTAAATDASSAAAQAPTQTNTSASGNGQSNDISGAAVGKDGKTDAAVKREQIMVGSWMAGIAVLLIIVFILISQRS